MQQTSTSQRTRRTASVQVHGALEVPSISCQRVAATPQGSHHINKIQKCVGLLQQGLVSQDLTGDSYGVSPVRLFGQYESSSSARTCISELQFYLSTNLYA